MQTFLDFGARGNKSATTAAAIGGHPASRSDQPNAHKTGPWVEKYRPKKVSDVIYQDDVVNVLKTAILKNELPHLLFYGPAGTGKTSTILAACREMFGPEHLKTRVLELNASDDRGISAIREKVKTFAQGVVTQDANSASLNGKRLPPFKIIILDECDALTTDAQAALRRIIEVNSSVTRFCLVCNYLTRIIEPIASRCAKFRFKPIEDASLLRHLSNICDKENIQFAPKNHQVAMHDIVEDQAYKTQCLQHLIAISNGDLRRAINLLQSCHQWDSSNTHDDCSNMNDNELDLDLDAPPELPPVVTTCLEDLQELSGSTPAAVVDSFYTDLAALPATPPSKVMQKMVLTVKQFIQLGYPCYALLTQLTARVVAHESLSDLQKAEICQKIAVIDGRLVEGADEETQLLDLATTIYQALKREVG